MITAKITPRTKPLSNNEALTLIAQLANSVIVDLLGATVYSGYHRDEGFVHLVVPMMGDSLLLYPFATQTL